jgi:hypothetical protein
MPGQWPYLAEQSLVLIHYLLPQVVPALAPHQTQEPVWVWDQCLCKMLAQLQLLEDPYLVLLHCHWNLEAPVLLTQGQQEVS